MQVCTSLQTDNHASTPPLRLSFLQAGCPSYCPTNRVKALKAQHKHSRSLLTSCCRTDNKRPHHCWHLPKKDWEYWLLARYSLHSIMGSEMPPKLPIPLGYLSPTHINTWFLGPTGVHSLNSSSAVFVGLTVVTDTHSTQDTVPLPTTFPLVGSLHLISLNSAGTSHTHSWEN